MQPRYQVSRSAIALIKRFEGYRSKSAQLPDGRWTIGYGHTLTAREGAQVSESDAEALLTYDLIAIAKAVNEWVFTPLSQNQFDSLCAFAFNIGLDNFRRSSVLRRLNEGSLIQAACAMELWRKADFEGERIVVDALVRRRAAEKTLFLTPPGGFVPVPTPVLAPNLDLDAVRAVPRDPPAVLKADLDGPLANVERDTTTAFQPVIPDEELGPSPAQAAAEAVTARLAAIFPDEPPAEAAEPQTPPAQADEPLVETPVIEEPVAEAERLDLAEPPAEEEVPAPESQAEAAQASDEPELDPAPKLSEAPPEPANDAAVEPVLPAPPVPPEDDEAFPRILGAEPSQEDFDTRPDDTEGERLSYPLVIGLGLAGGLLFAGGIFWAVTAQGGPGAAWVLGWFAGLAGIVMLGRAAYLILERLGQVGGGLDDQ
jgi:lysozyme